MAIFKKKFVSVQNGNVIKFYLNQNLSITHEHFFLKMFNLALAMLTTNRLSVCKCLKIYYQLFRILHFISSILLKIFFCIKFQFVGDVFTIKQLNRFNQNDLFFTQ